MESPYFRIRKSRYSAGFSIATASVFYIWISTVNDCSTARYWWCAVAYPTKILFWKRITASWCLFPPSFCCCLSYKDTILKANHSMCTERKYCSHAVAYPTKILFWKRITAVRTSHKAKQQLLLILQRYYFESESQPFIDCENLISCCCLSYKDTILKANHSILSDVITHFLAVAYPTKILFWKRITATSVHVSGKVRLLLILQRYYFESESQQDKGNL